MDAAGGGKHQQSSKKTFTYASRGAPPPPKLRRFQRLIIIDGFNVMRGFNNLIRGLQHSCDSRMNAIILLPIIRSFTKNGFRVRVALKRLPKPFEVLHMYILNELNKMQLLIYPEKDFLEADDEMMLKIAAQHGAIIISNDAFSNHHQYRAVAKTNTIKYKKERNPHFSLEELQHRLVFEYKFKMDGSNDAMYCSQGSSDYAKVKDSYNTFWPLTRKDISSMNSLWEYLYSGICYQMGFGKSLKCLNAEDESCPKKFEDFKNYNHGF